MVATNACETADAVMPAEAVDSPEPEETAPLNASDEPAGISCTDSSSPSLPSRKELKKQAKYDQKLSQARAMVARCQAYNDAKEVVRPSVKDSNRSRIHLKAEPDRPDPHANSVNRLHVRRDVNGSQKDTVKTTNTSEKQNTSVPMAAAGEETTVYTNATFEIPTENTAMKSTGTEPASSSGYLDYNDTGLGPERKVKGRKVLFGWSKASQADQSLLTTAGPEGETAKERKKREKFERDLAKARAQVARLPGYNPATAPKPPPAVLRR